MQSSIRSAISVLLVVVLGIHPLSTAAWAGELGADNSSDRAQAKRATIEGNRLYKSGRFEEAARHYARAYRLSSEPALLFNLGQCSKNLGDHERAVFFYSTYLREQPTAPNRDVAKILLEESRQAAERRKQFRAHRDARRASHKAAARRSGGLLDETGPDRGEDDSSFYQTWWFWTAVGVAATAAGVTLYATSRDGSAPASSVGVIDWR